jgi:hypothetical protein
MGTFAAARAYSALIAELSNQSLFVPFTRLIGFDAKISGAGWKDQPAPED